MSSMKGSKTVFCVQLYIMWCYWWVLNRCLITAEIEIYGTGINKPRYAAIKKIKNWHRKHFEYFRRSLLYIDTFRQKFSVKETPTLKARKVCPLLHLGMVGDFLSFSQQFCIISNALKSFYFSFCRWEREIRKTTFMSQQVTAKRQLEWGRTMASVPTVRNLLPRINICIFYLNKNTSASKKCS